jgi:endonuclease III
MNINKKHKKLLLILKELYPNSKSELNFINEFQLLVSVVLSAQCTDKKVNEITPKLFSKFPTPSNLAKAEITELEHIIKPINYYKTKAKHLIATAKILTENYNEMIPQIHDDLIKLPGVGQKTANVIQCERGLPALPVDTHVFRVAKRIGIAKGDNHKKVEKELCEQFSSKSWRMLHHSLIFHGRRVCKAQKPNCNECKIYKICDYYISSKGNV